MALLKDFYGRQLLRIESGDIREFSGMIKYRYDNDYVKEFNSQKILFKISHDEIRDFSGMIILRFDGTNIKNFSGQTLYRVDGNLIREFSGNIIYKIDGFISHRELMALIAILFA